MWRAALVMMTFDVATLRTAIEVLDWLIVHREKQIPPRVLHRLADLRNDLLDWKNHLEGERP